MLETAGSPGGGVAFDGEEIFGAPGKAVEGTAVAAAGEIGVGFAGVGEGAVFGEGDVEVEEGIVALEAGDVHAGEVDGGDFAAADEIGEGHGGLEGEIFEVGGDGEGGGSSGEDGLFALGVESGAGWKGVEDPGRGDGVGDVEAADFFIALAVFVEAVEHGIAVFGGDGDAGEDGGLGDHLGGDFGQGRGGGGGRGLGGGLRGEGVEGSGKEGGSEAEAAGDREEVAAIHGEQSTAGGHGARAAGSGERGAGNGEEKARHRAAR